MLKLPQQNKAGNHSLVITLVAGSLQPLPQDTVDDLVRQFTEQGGLNCISRWLETGIAADIFCQGLLPEFVQKLVAEQITDKPIDYFVQPFKTRRKKLLVADLESTIIEQEMLDELGHMLGFGEQIEDITRRAMNGEIELRAALDQRIALLAGQPETLLKTTANKITAMSGAVELLSTMKAEGAICWLISGGFDCFANIVAEQLGFDRYFANQLEIIDGHLSGRIIPPLLDRHSKQRLLEQACAEHKIHLSEAVAVGDGANDLMMLHCANEGGGLGVAFRAKPIVREQIAPQINHGDLRALIYAQGLIPSS